MDRLALAERETLPRHRDGLRLQALQVHLDAVIGGVVERAMAERRQVEIAAELAVHPPQDVEIEPRRDAGGIVVGGVEHRLVLDAVNADDHRRAAAQDAAGLAKEFRRVLRLEIADRRSGKEADARAIADLRRQIEVAREVGRHREHGDLRQVAPHRGCLLREKFRRDIDRHVGGDLRRGIEQDARLFRGAGAELDQRGGERNVGRHRARVARQNTQLGAGRIILGKPRDLLEQVRAGGVIKIFRRKPFRIVGQAR